MSAWTSHSHAVFSGPFSPREGSCWQAMGPGSCKCGLGACYSPIPDCLSQNLHSNQNPWGSLCTARVERQWFWTLDPFLTVSVVITRQGLFVSAWHAQSSGCLPGGVSLPLGQRALRRKEPICPWCLCSTCLMLGWACCAVDEWMNEWVKSTGETPYPTTARAVTLWEGEHDITGKTRSS